MKVYEIVSKLTATTNAKVYVKVFNQTSMMREEVYLDRGSYLDLCPNDKQTYPFGATVTQVAIANNVFVIYATVK